MKIKIIVFIVLLLFISLYSLGQNTKTDTLKVTKNTKLKFNYKQIIIPSVLISYGLIGINSDQLKLFNLDIKEEINEHLDEKLSIDDFSQYAPAVAFLGLQTLGIKGKNNFKDKSIILATSYLILGLSVNSLKFATKVERPDGTSFNSFPSGHTATAFMGAELLYQDYKNVSVWYGVSGYVVAAGTGIFRMYNNRHWFTDVVAGAGIGILSAKAGYWLYPTISKLFINKKTTNNKTVLVPFYDGKTTGFGLVSTF